MENQSSIVLVDNTAPTQQPDDLSPRATGHDLQGSLSRHLTRASVTNQLAKRKYAKWQPERLGIPSNTNNPISRESSRGRGSSVSVSSGTEQRSGQSPPDEAGRDVDTTDFAPSRVHSRHNQTNSVLPAGSAQQQQQQHANESSDENSTPVSELDILYENQRGWFLFGVPRYSHSSLLNLDPGAWMTPHRKESPVNITNAQLPDPSWEWTWRTWYVDMSGDVDEQGWQYSLSFGSSAWHGTQPWFHSFVRRRRWVRLRNKIAEKRRVRSDFEKAHMLTEDYFTIHSSKGHSREKSSASLSKLASGYLSRVTTRVAENAFSEEIGDIPTLMYALKRTSIDREKIDVLRKFIQEGGEELYYLNDKIPEIMSMFLFQASRWQFVSYLDSIIHELSKTAADPDGDGKDADQIKRKQDNLVRAAETGRLHITGPDVFADDQGESVTGMLDLTPVSRHGTLLSKRPMSPSAQLSGKGKGKDIKGIPIAAEVGREGHIQ